MKIDLSKVCDVKVYGVDPKDHPDYCDAYIESGSIEISREEYNLCKGNNQIFFNGKYYRDLTDGELDYINDNCRDFVHEQVEKWLH